MYLDPDNERKARADRGGGTLGEPGDALAQRRAAALRRPIESVEVHGANGAKVPVALRDGKLVPQGTVGSGERLTVELTVRRPGWAGWLVGSTERRTFTVETPSAHLLGRWLQVKAGGAVTVAFDQPVSLVSLAGSPRATPRGARRPPCRSASSRAARTAGRGRGRRGRTRLGAPARRRCG